MIKIITFRDNKAYYPELYDGITVSWERKGAPGTLKFSYVNDNKIKFQNGDAVKMVIDGKDFFFGFIFQLKYGSDDKVDAVVYDQLRYLKNKDSVMYKGKRADEVIKMLAKTYGMNAGALENTKYVIPKKVEDNKTLFDIIQNALDDTIRSTGKMYVLYDEVGKLRLKDVEKMKTDFVINENTAQSVDYSRSIDKNTYNQIKLAYDNKDTGTREIYMEKDSKNINKWGVLQYFEKLDSEQGAKVKAKQLLGLYNNETRNLKINKAIGSVKVRAGSSVIVKMKVGELNLSHYLVVEKVTHNFKDEEHFMDLTLRGGVINA